MFFKVLHLQIAKRITKETFENYLKILSEPYLFDFLIEDTINDEEIIGKITNNSLFKVQIEKNTSISHL